MKRNNIRDIDLLERILKYIILNIAAPFSANSISKYFKSNSRKVSVETILNYIKACENAYLFSKVPREELKGKNILTINEKYYLTDLGIRTCLGADNIKDINLALENIVYQELLIKGYNIHVGTINQKEIDFVATKGDKKIYIQVSYLLASEETIKREFDVYMLVPDNYPKYVITLDEFCMSQNGIIHLNIIDFLLGEEI